VPVKYKVRAFFRKRSLKAEFIFLLINVCLVLVDELRASNKVGVHEIRKSVYCASRNLNAHQ
jgi:hypothetical protein